METLCHQILVLESICRFMTASCISNHKMTEILHRRALCSNDSKKTRSRLVGFLDEP